MELQVIQKKIYEIRGHKVMLDFDLADIYEVETRVLNQAVKRNMDIFPMDFMFQLNETEWKDMSSQTVMTLPSKRPKTSLPLAFTEHGVAMLANLLKSKKARQTSVALVRAFIALKEYALTHAALTKQLKALELKYDKKFNDVAEAINYLLTTGKQKEITEHRVKIGFKVDKKK